MPSPYLLLPAFVALSFSLSAGFLSIEAALACVPLAALAGDSFGWRGVGMVAVGGLLLPFGVLTPVGGFPAESGVYLLSLALAALLASRWPIPSLTTQRRPSVGLVAAFVLLPLYVVVARERLDNGVETYVSVSLLPLLYFLLFLAGWARAYKPLVIGALVVATIAGIAWDLAIELGRIGYTLDTPADFLTGLASFILGGYVHNLFDGRESTSGYRRWPLTTLAGLLLLWGGYLLVASALDASGQYRRLVLQLAPVGSYYALPIAALFAGVRFRFRGVAAVTLIATAVEALGPLLRLDGANLGTPLVAFAFAALGVHLCDRAAGRTTPWSPWRWVTLTLFGLVGLPPLMDLRFEAVTDLAVLAAGVATLILVTMLVRSLLHRVGIHLEATASRGWLALFGSVLLALGMLSSFKDFWLASGTVVTTIRLGSLGLGDSSWEPNNAALLGIGALFYLVLLLTAVAASLNHLSSLVDSGARLATWFKISLTAGRLVPAANDGTARRATEDDTARPAWLRRSIRIIRWSRNALLLIALSLGLLIMVEALL